MKYMFPLLFFCVACLPARSQCTDSSVNCTGECGEFIDANHDGFCDLGILDLSLLHRKAAPGTTEKKKNADTFVAAKKPVIDTVTSHTELKLTPVHSARTPKRSPYHLLEIALPLISFYSAMAVLARRKIIPKLFFYRVWNVFLLLTFLTTGLLGLLLTAKLIYHLQLPYISTIYLVHVDFGVAMALISCFHLLRHWNYYKQLLK